MRIASLAAGTVALTNQTIETSIHKLGFTFKPSSITATTAEAIVQEVIGTTKITLIKQDGASTETLLQRLSLADVAEISAYNEGVVFIDTTAKVVEFTLEISNAGAFKLDDSAKLILNIDDKPNVALDIEALDHMIQTHEYIRYEARFVNANSTKDFSIENHYAVAVPADILDAIELNYENGKVLKLSQSEAKKLLRDSQDPILNLDGKTTYGYAKFLVLAVDHCHKISVTTTDNQNIYLLRNAIA